MMSSLVRTSISTLAQTDRERDAMTREAALLYQTPQSLIYSDYEKLLRKENREYLAQMKNILTAPRRGMPKGSDAPGELLDWLWIGNKREARNMRMLRRLGITHVLNCAALPEESANGQCNSDLYDPKVCGVRNYAEFEARDNDGYPILRRHFRRAKRFIDEARDTAGGRALVHCELGVNRSGAICIAYIMLAKRLTLLQTLRRVKTERPVILVNEGFQKELIEFAREHDLLYKDDEESSSSRRF